MTRLFRFLLLPLSFALSSRAYDTVVAFNEVNYNPGGAGEEGEWIILHNQNGVNVWKEKPDLMNRAAQ